MHVAVRASVGLALAPVPRVGLDAAPLGVVPEPRVDDIRCGVEEFGRTLGEELLEPTRIYAKDCLALAAEAEVHQIELLDGIHSAEVSYPLPVLYRLAVERAADKLVRSFRLALEADGPVLVHCAAGKDRTGIVSAMLLSAAGARPDSIVADYIRTDQNMFRVLQRLELAPALPPGVTEEDVRRDIVSAPVSAIEVVLEQFDAYDGAAAVELARHNAQLAEVDDIVRFEAADARTFHWGGMYGRIVINPPYGERIMERREAEEQAQKKAEQEAREQGS